jgi:hypothetical protein
VRASGQSRVRTDGRVVAPAQAGIPGRSGERIEVERVGDCAPDCWGAILLLQVQVDDDLRVGDAGGILPVGHSRARDRSQPLERPDRLVALQQCRRRRHRRRRAIVDRSHLRGRERHDSTVDLDPDRVVVRPLERALYPLAGPELDHVGRDRRHGHERYGKQRGGHQGLHPMAMIPPCRRSRSPSRIIACARVEARRGGIPWRYRHRLRQFDQ